MNKAVKNKWVKALRSGDYHQGKSFLRILSKKGAPDRFCCLGVLCEVMGNKVDYGVDMRNGCGRYDGYTSQLPFDLRVELDITSAEQVELINMNDAGGKFPEIADWIEENL